MCAVSMVADHYRDKFYPMPLVQTTDNLLRTAFVAPVSRAEFDALKRDVEEMKALLRRAKKYDEDNGEPDCEMDEKVALIRRVADAVGVDLTEVFGTPT